MNYIYVGFGGAIGAVVRYIIGRWVTGWNSTSFPFGTFFINITGSFLIGLITTLALERSLISPRWRLTLTTGLLGGYTTFSTFSYETIGLLQQGKQITALLYITGSIFLGLAGAFAGIAAARKWETGRMGGTE